METKATEVSVTQMKPTDSPSKPSRSSIIAVRFRTQLCRNFSSEGYCRYEEGCMFAHGEPQLRTMDQNRAEGITSDEAIQAFIRDNSMWSKTMGKPISPMKGNPATDQCSAAAASTGVSSIARPPSEPAAFFPPPEYGAEPATWARVMDPSEPNLATVQDATKGPDSTCLVLPNSVTFDMDDVVHRIREVNSVESTHLYPSSSHECCGNSANSSLVSDPAEERGVAGAEWDLEDFSLVRGQSGYLLYESDGRYRHNPYAW